MAQRLLLLRLSGYLLLFALLADGPGAMAAMIIFHAIHRPRVNRINSLAR